MSCLGTWQDAQTHFRPGRRHKVLKTACSALVEPSPVSRFAATDRATIEISSLSQILLPFACVFINI